MAQMTLDQFGQTIKAKHPEYADMDNTALAQKVLAKYPQYQDMVSAAPTLDLSNKQGQGTYSMKDQSGKTVPVPYGQVQQAAQLGYSFADDANKFRYAKDNAADPNKVTSFTPAANDPRGNPDYQDQMERNAPLPLQIAGGISKGAGTLARPLLDAAAVATRSTPQQINDMLVSRTPTEAAAKYATMGAATAPAIAAAPVASAVGGAAGTLGAAGGAAGARQMGLSPQLTQLLSDAAGLGSGIAGAEVSNVSSPIVRAELSRVFPRLADNPEGLVTQAVRGSVNKNNVGWNSDVQRAIPLVKSTEQAAGGKIGDLDDAIDAGRATLQSLWQRYKQFQGPSAQMGATIDGNKIADAMEATIGPRLLQNNPQRAAQITAQAERYRRPIPVDEAEEFLSGNGGVNNELHTYYAKNKTNRRAAEADPDMAATVAEGDALRDSLYSKMDDLFGPGASQLKKDYGAVRNLLNVLQDRKLVYERQAPVNLPEQRAYVSAAGKALTGDLFGAGREIAAQRFFSKLNDTNDLIARAFSKAQPASPMPVPSQPAPAGFLPRGPIQMGAPPENTRVSAPPPAYSPTTRAQRLGLMLPAPAVPRGPIVTPPPADASGPVSYEPPAYSPTTRAQRQGRMLPSQAGPEILPYYPQMGNDEQLAALLHYLRNNPKQLKLAAKSAAIPLPSGK